MSTLNLRPNIVEENLPISMESNQGWDTRIQCVKCGDLVRSYLIKTERFVLVYDTLLGPKSGQFLREQALEFAQGLPLMVLNSHADWDHYFGNMVFPEPILGSRVMVDRVSNGVGAKELRAKRAEHPESYGAVELKAPIIGLGGDCSLFGGDLTLELLFTKGHRPDHLAIYIPEISTLLAGDCVEDPIPLVDEDSDESSDTLKELIASLQRFVDLQPQWVLANHAPPQASLERVQSNLGYLQSLKDTATSSGSLDALKLALPIQQEWGSFYQKAHLAHLRMAWQQTRGPRRQWADD